jgi:hypothetical protein
VWGPRLGGPHTTGPGPTDAATTTQLGGMCQGGLRAETYKTTGDATRYDALQ